MTGHLAPCYGAKAKGIEFTNHKDIRVKHAMIAVGIAIALASSSANAGVMVHMFGWKYNDIANECENVLGPKGYDGVEVSSPAEHVTGNGWWIAYQPVNYKNFTAIGGNETELKSMITRCHKVGIKVYADAVFNQMSDSSGTSSPASFHSITSKASTTEMIRLTTGICGPFRRLGYPVPSHRSWW